MKGRDAAKGGAALVLADFWDSATRENDDNSGTIVVAYRIGKRTREKGAIRLEK